MRDPDAELDALHVRLHEARIYKEGKAKTEPFRGFIASYNKLQEALCKNADADIIEQHRHSALVAAPAVRAALGDHSPMETAPTANGDVSTRTGPSPERSAEHTLDAARGTAAAVKAALGNALVITATDEPKAPDPPVATEPVASTDNRQDALALVPHAAEVCAADVDNETNPASEITRLHGEIAAAYGMSWTCAIRIGELLTQQKEALKHGHFLPWVAEHLPFSERTARNYMSLFKHRAELESANVADLTAAYRLAAPRKTKPANKPKPSEGHGTEQASQNDPRPHTNDAADTGHGGQQAQQDDEQPQARAEPGDAPDEQTEATSTSDEPENDTISTTAGTATAAHELQQRQTEPTDAKATAPETTTESKTPPITLKQAYGVVLRAVRTSKPTFARNVIERVATEGGVTVWMPTASPRDDLSKLEDLLADRLEAVADKDLDDATSWAREHVERLNAIIAERQTPQDDGSGDDTTDDSDADMVDTDGSDEDTEADDVQPEQPKRRKARGPMG